jgi:secreted trypsin-like serine protease
MVILLSKSGESCFVKKAFCLKVSVLRECGPQFCHICGGTIISPAWILTGAHCTNSIPVEVMGVLLGDHNLYELSYEQKFMRVMKKIIHPGKSDLYGINF